MIKLKNGCKARNVQEQVAYNTDEIIKLKYLVGEAYIELDDTALTHTGTITADMKKILDKYEVVFVILKQDDDLYQVFRTDYYEQKFRKCAFFVGGSLHKLDLDYDNSTWSYSEQAIGGVQVQSDWNQTDTTQVDFIKNKPEYVSKLKDNINVDNSGNVEFIHDVKVDGDIKINSAEYLTDSDGKNLIGSPLELTGTSGTLTTEQYNFLINCKSNYIRLKINVGTSEAPVYVYENYYLMDDKVESGYLGYSHVEKESTNYKIKTITITISTKGWVLTEQPVPSVLDPEELGKVLTSIKISATGVISSNKGMAIEILRNSKIADENEAVAFHNAIPGGRDLSSYFTDSTDWDDGKPQFWKRLQGGTFNRSATWIAAHPNEPTSITFTLFEGLFVGDYWKMTENIRSRQDNNGAAQTNEGTDYVMIAGFDTMWGNGEESYKVNYHHIVCIPGKPDGSTMLAFGQHRMNETDTSANGYKNTQLHSTVIGSPTTTAKRFSTYNTATINEQLYAEFGAHLATTHELLSNGMQTSRVNRWGEATGGASSWEWTTCQAVLMSEIEVYGSIAVSSTAHDVGNAKAQLPVFRFFPQALNNRSCWYWLKAISHSPSFCSCSSDGGAGGNDASRADAYVRPRFVLKA